MVRFFALFFAILLGGVFLVGILGMHESGHVGGPQNCLAARMGGEVCPPGNTLIASAAYHARAVSNFSVMLLVSALLALAALLVLRFLSPVITFIARPPAIVALRMNRMLWCASNDARRAWLADLEHSPTFF